MANLKSLVKDTAIYGLSSIVARFINYFLVPIQTARFSASGGQYGVITNLCLYLAAHHPAHLRHGDHVLPLYE